MVIPANAKRLLLKYRRRINADTFSGGKTYGEIDDFPAGIANADREGTEAEYGHAAQTNQEILDLMENAANLLIDQIAGLAMKDTSIPAGRFMTYGILESIIPEYVKTEIEQAQATREMVVVFSIYDYSYPISVTIERGSVVHKAEPATLERWTSVIDWQNYEYNNRPIYRVQRVGSTVTVRVYFQNIATLYPALYVEVNFSYVSKQKKIDVNNDLLFSSKYDEHLLNIMVQSYTGYK